MAVFLVKLDFSPGKPHTHVVCTLKRKFLSIFMRCMARLRQNLRGFKLPRKALKNRQLYILLFTLTLSLLVCISAVPSYSQTPTPTPSPTPRTVIEQKVRELANSDVENDIPRRNDYAVKLYGKKSPGFKDDEILQIYDDEYTKQNDNKKTNFLKKLPAKNEWFAAIIIFLLFTFNDVVKEWITNFIKYIRNLFYNLLSGTPLFNTISLREYRNGLIEKYQQSSIPYLPQRPLDLHQVYIPLEVESPSENRTDVVNILKKHRRLILKGESGSGKSMLLKYIAFSYAKGHFKNPDANSKNTDKWNDVFSDQPIPILVELRRLNDSDKTLQQHFLDALDRDGFSNGKRFVEHNLEQGKLMLLLDGLDEVNSNILWRVIRDIKDLLDTNSKCRVIITCRTAVYKDEFGRLLKSAGSGSFETLAIADFNENQIRSFLHVWEREMPPRKSITELTNTLQREARTYELAQRPLILAIIAYLYTYNDLTLVHSSTEFYRNATDILLDQWYSEVNQFLLEEKKRILQQLALFYQEQLQSPYRQDSQKVLNYLRDVIRKLDIDVEPNQAKSLLEEIVNRSGLMIATDNGTIYQFVHRSFQEFFVAQALQEEEKKNNQSGFEDLFALADTQEKVTGIGIGNEKYLIEKFNQDQDSWQEIVRFWCSLAENPTYVIENVYEKNQILALELLAEIQVLHTDIAGLANKIIDEFKKLIFAKTDKEEIDRISHAFSSLAVNNAFREESEKNKIFNFFREIVETKENYTPDRYKIAVNILSMTYTVEAANILISQYTQREQNYELRLILDQAFNVMGEIAVPEIKKAVNKSSINQVMDALVGIATPSALQALVNWLWDKDENRALRAALLLTSLIKEVKHKTMLNAYELPQLDRQNNLNSFNWIVEPYTKAYRAEGSLSTILLQIVYCINKKLKEPVEIIDQLYIHLFDQQLIIPICLIQAGDNQEFKDSLNSVNLNLEEITSYYDYDIYIHNLCGQNLSTLWGFLISNISPIAFVPKRNNLSVKKLKALWQKEEVRFGRDSFSVRVFKIIVNQLVNQICNKLGGRIGGMLKGMFINMGKEKVWIKKNKEIVWGVFIAKWKEESREFEEVCWEGKIIINKKLARPHKI
jgi:hypothetical protein